MLTDADRQLVDDLIRIQALKFGEFKLKSGALSPFYLDLRVLISYPRVLQAVAQRILAVLRRLEFQRIAGIPYAGLPIATAVSLAGDLPLVYPRKEAKAYGTGRIIEGNFTKGEVVVPIDDVISDGASKFESAAPLLEAGLVIKDFVVFLDREQGGEAKLAERGFQLHSALRITAVLDYLKEDGRLSAELHRQSLAFLAAMRG
ncbi:MAG TPA: orotate phosphoribosyltransferase [Candidatus Sulfotelmatobacter sp.]|nr:orotate phosphoribosyltransferase [Candidatus Sulfotelmatobacter sp.]